jgi:uncharacterized protein
VLRAARPQDFSAVLALNEANVEATSALDQPKLEALASQADYFKVFAAEDQVAGFLIAFREEALYTSPNFLWFKKHYPRFLYIDRVVVDQQRRQSGIASTFYVDVESHARAARVPVVTCEVNLQPPNPISLAFHQRKGFVEVGTLTLESKTVSLQAKRLVVPAAS